MLLRAALATALLLSAGRLHAQAVVRFSHDVRPILANRCFKCHGPDLKKGNLDLQQRETALKALRSGAQTIVPGHSGKSALIERITSEVPRERMPPKGDPLSPREVALLKAWIDQGAKYEEHWAYVKPVRPPLPAVRLATWPRSALDYFVLARLEKEGSRPAPEADRAALARRVSLDLLGLPPTFEDLEAFLNDPRPDAYERYVERLLASPHFGEQMARYWLDHARYADTNGYEKDERRTIWPFRDWVIAAFNSDMPFDQFTLEQLAGDLLPGASLSQRIATGFHRNTMTNTEGGTDDEEFRVAAVVDRVNTTFEVWLGTTMACAQCHNHKYDPITQVEYYRAFAFFNSTTDGGKALPPVLNLPTPGEQARQGRLAAELASLKRVPREVVGLAGAGAVQSRIKKLEAQRKGIKPSASTLVLQEMPKPRPTHVLLRGNHKSKGDRVEPGTPRLHPFRADLPRNRAGFAKWLTDPDNPLTARVAVNRLWARTFGKGFVETSEEFGVQGDLPTHPELLDWLATEFMRRGWSFKALLREIVTSSTYRQSSRVAPEVAKVDPFNRLLARGPRFRLDAEAVRDNALAIGGLLSRKLGGPSVFPYQPDGVWFNPYSGDRWVMSTAGDEHRRGMYTFWRRTAPYAAFMAFDAPSREVCAERRPHTNTPLQALATLNDRPYVEASLGLARRMMTEASGGVRERAVLGFRLCTARVPTEREVALLLELREEALGRYRKDGGAARALVTQGPGWVRAGLDEAEMAAWTVVANVLLNLDETISKE